MKFKKCEINRIFFITLFALFLCSLCFGKQGFSIGHQKDKGNLFNFSSSFSAEIIETPKSTMDSIFSYVCYKIPYKLLPFKKVSGRELYFSTYSVEVEFKDSIGVIRKRIFDKDTITLSDYEETKSDNLCKIGLLQTTMPISEYKISVKLFDANSRQVDELNFNQFFSNIAEGKGFLASPIFAYKDNIEDETFFPFIHKNSIDFTAPNASVLLQIAFKPSINGIFYSIETNEERNRDNFWNPTLSLKGELFPKMNKTFQIEYENNRIVQNIIDFNIDTEKKQNYEIGIVEIEIPEDEIIPGVYKLKLWANGAEDSISIDFKIDWFAMPITLRQPDFAVEAMYYILTDAEYKELRSGPRKDLFPKILNYWQPHDPTPQTAFNEAMAEYFKRVDYAMLNFETLSEKNGAKTDRGKIYILFGPPTETKQSNENGINVEIWKYDNLKKEFIFEVESMSNYLLKKIIEN